MTDERAADYRGFIDRMVDESRSRHERVLEQLVRGSGGGHEMEALVARTPDDDRRAWADRLHQEFTSGVFAVLRALHERQIPPFDLAYEGAPFNDFIGRLQGVDGEAWPWPDVERT